jgi:hypothetical protein
MKNLFDYKINFIKRNPMLSVGISFFKGVIITLLVVMFLASCTPVRYVYIDPKDSVVVKQRVVYDNLYVPSPIFLNYNWVRPYYNPIIINIPQRQNRYTPQNRYSNRFAPQRRTIPNRPLPNRAPREKR